MNSQQPNKKIEELEYIVLLYISRHLAMEAMLATEHQDKAFARRSLDLTYLDDIPEEQALSGKASEEKELTRVDSGLGEWDSESSRKTSFSSQGRLSPDFAMSKVRFISS